MKPNNTYKLSAASFILIIILACNALVPAPTTPVQPTAPIIPTGTNLVTSVPLSQQVTLISQPFSETNQTPPFTILSQTPQLAGSDDPRVQAFNQRLNELVQKEVDTFRQSFLQNIAPPISTGSFLEVTYTLVSQIADIWSIKLDFSFYSDGAAHPGLYSITVNHDLGQGRKLALSDLFLPNSNYLEVISNYSIADLKRQNPDIDDSFLGGTAPTSENYRNWNITTDGLMITFDEYQVAPYAAGPQKVIMPYNELQAVIDPKGPLGKLNQ
jgi:hypothetical protein